MEQKQYHYDAFISYRHTELDKFVAENLHKQLEAYRMPKSTLKGRVGQKNRIERVFRDKDELPLTSNLEDPIIQALQNSEWLLVICSPRLRESAWCKKEIETFVALRGRERVLAVLVEGEPAESFPDELLFEIREEVGSDGTKQEVKVPVEPLAADVRGKNKKEILKNMKTELLRILAAMFAVPYDDLRQRHRERRMRRILTASLVGGAAGLLFGGYCATTAVRISNQNKQIEAQSQEIATQNEKLATNQALNLAEKANQYLDEGNREDALQTAYQALTEVDGVAMPYTPEAHHALAESLRVYDMGDVYKSSYQIEMMGIVEDVIVSEEDNLLGIYDDTGALTVWDMYEREVLLELPAKDVNIGIREGYSFLQDNRLICFNPDWKGVIYNLRTGQVEAILDEDGSISMCIDPFGRYVVFETLAGENILYDTRCLERKGALPMTSVGSALGDLFFGDGSIVAMTDGQIAADVNTIAFVNIENMQVVSQVEVPFYSVEEVRIQGDTAYIAGYYMGEYPDDSVSYVYRVDISTGEFLWENKREGCSVEGMELPLYSTGKELLLVTNELVSMIDMENGTTTFTSILNSEIINSYPVSYMDGYYAFCQDSSWIGIAPGNEFVLEQNILFDCKTDDNDYIEICNGDIVVVPATENRITVYSREKGPDLVTSTREIVEKESTVLSGDEAVELVLSYGLENSDFVRDAFYGEGEKYLFVNYWNDDLVIYDTEEHKIVNTVESISISNGYLGKDHNGYTYIKGFGTGYVLNQNMELMLSIPNLADVDFENDKVYLRRYGTGYEGPLYTAEELVELAKEQLEQ